MLSPDGLRLVSEVWVSDVQWSSKDDHTKDGATDRLVGGLKIGQLPRLGGCKGSPARQVWPEGLPGCLVGSVWQPPQLSRGGAKVVGPGEVTYLPGTPQW
jgi:hypothetical protein